MAKIEITEKDLSLIESALSVVSGRGFGYGAKKMKVRTMKGIFEVTDDLRKLATRMRDALNEQNQGN